MLIQTLIEIKTEIKKTKIFDFFLIDRAIKLLYYLTLKHCLIFFFDNSFVNMFFYNQLTRLTFYNY